jgi:SAM-dependent methyltransferase
VLATDFDPRFLLTIRLPNLEAQQHDIVRDGLPRSSFDLIHMRLLLAHVLQREFALDKMIAALKPGGWILAEEMDFTAMAAEPTVDAERGRLFDRLAEAHRRVTSARGFDQFFGRRLFSPTDGGCLGPPPARWLSKLPGQAAAERR